MKKIRGSQHKLRGDKKDSSNHNSIVCDARGFQWNLSSILLQTSYVYHFDVRILCKSCFTFLFFIGVFYISTLHFLISLVVYKNK